MLEEGKWIIQPHFTSWLWLRWTALCSVRFNLEHFPQRKRVTSFPPAWVLEQA